VDPVSARAQGAAAEIVFTGLPLSEGVRYNVAFIPPEGLATTNLRAEIALPTDAVVVQANQTEGRTRFVGQDGSTLTWTAPGYDADRPVDGLSFVLTQPLSRPVAVRVSWESDAGPGLVEVSAQPDLFPAAVALTGTYTVSADPAQALAAVGQTGVRLTFPGGVSPEGATLRVTRLLADANPPAGVGSPWWCALITVDGAPQGFEPFVLVPARQPLPANARLTLFAQRDGVWRELEQAGRATVDGQFVGFIHPGGTVAAGIQTDFQPLPFHLLPFPSPTPTRLPLIQITPGPIGSTLTPTPRPTSPPPPPTPTPEPHDSLSIEVNGSSVVRSNLSDLHWTIKVTNSGNAASSDALYVNILGPSSPADWISISAASPTHGFTCRILQGLALLGETRAECANGLLAPGESAQFTLKGSTTAVVGGGDRTLEALLYNRPGEVASGNYTRGYVFGYTVNP